jgi:HTH-type transcriptional regulator / antitoxin HigA
MSNIEDERELLSKPGDTILETLEELRMSQADLAKRMGKTPSKINDLISGKEPITIATAIQLEKILGIATQFWMNRETLYREQLSRIEQEEALEECIDWLKQQPIKQLKEYGYIKSDKVGTPMVEEFLKFYAVDSPKQWEEVYAAEFANTSFRRSKDNAIAIGSITAWLRIGEIEISKIKLPEFDKIKFKKTLESVLVLVEEHPEDFAEKLKELARQSGVAVVYTIGLPNTSISGAVRWIGKNPLIQLTDRYKTNDQFWFTFFHEVGHIYLHGKKDIFIEEFEGYELNKEKENEANYFAANWLLSENFIQDLPDKELTLRDIRLIAAKYKTHPAIVLGRLQKLNRVKYSFGNDLRMKVDLDNYIKTQSK